MGETTDQIIGDWSLDSAIAGVDPITGDAVSSGTPSSVSAPDTTSSTSTMGTAAVLLTAAGLLFPPLLPLGGIATGVYVKDKISDQFNSELKNPMSWVVLGLLGYGIYKYMTRGGNGSNITIVNETRSTRARKKRK